MDKNFIQRATKITSFNLTAADFQSLRYKNEIQHLFGLYFFPDFDLRKTIDRPDVDSLNRLIDDLKKVDASKFAAMHKYNLKGIGPGEVTLYFLLNTAHLGGGSSAGIDIIVGSEPFEVKAVDVNNDRQATNFKLGGTVNLTPIMMELNDLRTRLKLGGSATEMSGTIMNEMRSKAPIEYKSIEQKFANIAADYFKSHKVIFINNSNSKLGKIEAIKNVKKEDVTIERVTSGTVKPRVKL